MMGQPTTNGAGRARTQGIIRSAREYGLRRVKVVAGVTRTLHIRHRCGLLAFFPPSYR